MNLVYLAQRIRDFRKKRMLTLEQLAERSQLTQSVLSKVENSRVTPSLAALSRIAEALGVSLSELVAGIDEEPRMIIVRRAERPLYERNRPDGNFIYRSIAPNRHTQGARRLMIEIPPGTPPEELPSHGGEDFILVLKGSVEIEYGGEQARLGPGDAVYLNSSGKCQAFNPGRTPTEIFCVFPRPERR